MIDYDASLQKFFGLVLQYLADSRARKADCQLCADIDYAEICVLGVANDPHAYADYRNRVQAGMEDERILRAFGGREEDPVYKLYYSVVCNLQALDSRFAWQRAEAQKKLLQSIKAMQFHRSRNMLKVLYYPLLPACLFGAQFDPTQPVPSNFMRHEIRVAKKEKTY